MFEPKPSVGFKAPRLGLEQRAREADVALEMAKLHAQAEGESARGLLHVDPGTRAGRAVSTPSRREAKRESARAAHGGAAREVWAQSASS